MAIALTRLSFCVRLCFAAEGLIKGEIADKIYKMWIMLWTTVEEEQAIYM